MSLKAERGIWLKRRSLWGVILLFCLPPILAGCGGGDNSPTAKKLVLPQPHKPTVAQCGHNSSTANPSEHAPAAGTYYYSTKGTRVLLGVKRREKALPAVTEIVITPARQVNNIRCYMTQHRYTSDLGDTATILMRGSDIYVSNLRFQSGGYIKTLSPNQPLLTLSGNELDWSGVFRGSTSGRYASQIIGHKTVRVGAQQVKAVGVETRISYDGDISGWERSTRWFDSKRNLVVAEDVTEQRNFGLDRLRLSYKAQLKSLNPS